MLPLLNYHSIMFLILSLNQRILISSSSSLRLGFLLCLAISCTSCFLLSSISTLRVYYNTIFSYCQHFLSKNMFFSYFLIVKLCFLFYNNSKENEVNK